MIGRPPLIGHFFPFHSGAVPFPAISSYFSMSNFPQNQAINGALPSLLSPISRDTLYRSIFLSTPLLFPSKRDAFSRWFGLRYRRVFRDPRVYSSPRAPSQKRRTFTISFFPVPLCLPRRDSADGSVPLFRVNRVVDEKLSQGPPPPSVKGAFRLTPFIFKEVPHRMDAGLFFFPPLKRLLRFPLTPGASETTSLPSSDYLPSRKREAKGRGVAERSLLIG